MNKKMMLSLAAAAMVGTLAVGGTLAWFTDTETATNIATTGKVDIKLDEDGTGSGIANGDGITYDDVMPGDTIKKNVTITNMENDAYVKVNLTVSQPESKNKPILAALKDTKDDSKDIVFAGLPGDLTWTENEDGSFTTSVIYRNGSDDILKAGEENAWTVFTDIIIPGEAWDNAFKTIDNNGNSLMKDLPDDKKDEVGENTPESKAVTEEVTE